MITKLRKEARLKKEIEKEKREAYLDIQQKKLWTYT